MKRIVLLTIMLAISLPAFAGNGNKPNKQKPLPPGLQKKLERTGTLPPGWQKKLVKGEVIDPGLYAVARHYPVDPAAYHLRYIKGTELFRLEDRIIRIANDTKVVLDVLGIKAD